MPNVCRRAAAPAIKSAPLPAPTLISLIPSDQDRACCSLVICPHECVAVADAVLRVPQPALLVIKSAPVPTAMLISCTPSPSLQEYGKVNADLPT